jgi:hypothetical protein
VPPVEMLQILIYIAEHNKIHGEQARLTLAGWDEASAKQLAADPDTPKEILDYWLSPKNIRLSVFELLLENRSVQMSKLAELGSTLKGEVVDVMIASPRVRNSMQVLNDISTNRDLTGTQAARVQTLIKGNNATAELRSEEKLHRPADVLASPALPVTTTAETAEDHSIPADPETEKVVAAFMTEHAAEIAADAGKPFQPIGRIFEEEVRAEEAPANASEAGTSVALPVANVLATASAATAAQPALAKKPSPHKVHVDPANEQRGSVLQKIAKLDIKGRIQLAMKGSKEERSILVRDGTKIVALAVLDSPKISDGEVEKFASQRNVLEAVLRAIPMKRRFIKNYAVVRNLVFNPRTPLDIGLGLMKNLLIADLRNLCGNKEVSDTIRKLALRNFKQKTEAGNKT